MFFLKKKPVFVLLVLIVSIFLGAFVFPIGVASIALFNPSSENTQVQTTVDNKDAAVYAQGVRPISRAGIFEPTKNYTREELKNMVDKSEPTRYYVSSKVAVSPSLIERGELDTTKLEAEYTLISKNRTMIEYNVTDYFLDHNNNIDTVNVMEVGGNDVSIASTGSENLVIEASGPNYWDRDATILVTITVTNFGWYPYSYAGYAKAYVLDYYYGYWTVEASGSRYVTFTLSPWQSIQITVLVDTDLTSVGLKRIKGGLNFGWYELLDDAGYNFVQRFSRYEYQLYPPTTVNTTEDLFELSDQFHFDRWEVIRKAGEAVDIMDSYIDTSYEAAIQVGHWVHNSFIYNPDYNVIPGTTLTFLNVVAADIYTLNHVFWDGKYHGVCGEYSTLYVSFMRALNVPARFMAMVFFDEDIGHFFAEVWVTKPSGNGYFWMHADPTYDFYNTPEGYSNVKAVTIWQQGYDAFQNWDGSSTDLLLAGMINLENAHPSGKKADFKIYFEYTGPNNYT